MVAVETAAAAEAFPPDALPPADLPPEAFPPAGLADFQPSPSSAFPPPFAAEVGADPVVDAGEGVTGTGGGVFALAPPPFVADPAAGGGVAGGAPPLSFLSPPLPPPLTPINGEKRGRTNRMRIVKSNQDERSRKRRDFPRDCSVFCGIVRHRGLSAC